MSVTELTVHISTLTANIRTRRGSKVAINLPIFFDENTPRPFIDPTIPWDRNIYKEDPGASWHDISGTEFTLIRVLQRPEMAQPSQITYIWMRWASEWVVAVYNSRFKHAT